MIDLDSFKPVNDIYGHDMGDKILIRFAEIIRSAVRQTDVAGRLGGDEFVAFCKHVSDESVIRDKARYINDQILESARELLGDDMKIDLGASIGAVIAPDEGTDFDSLYKKADQALYDVKQNGKHGYKLFFSERSVDDISDDSSLSGIANLSMIFGERGEARGAYVLSPDGFKVVYRFLNRIYNNYHKEVFVLLFSIEEKGQGELPMDMVMKLFEKVLCDSLRQSDVVTRSGKNQYIILLFNTTRNNIEVVVDRIRSNWARSGGSSGYELSFELDLIS